jgi:hypothetical protein
VVKHRRGATTFGCLLTTLLMVAIGYFGHRIGQVYWTAKEYEGVIKASVMAAETLTDKQIYDRIVAKADSLGLPEEAKEISLERVGRHITVSADYMVMVELPLHNRSLHFSPSASHDY